MPIDTSSLTAQEQATAIYVAYYDRAPDPAGLQFWTDQIQGGLSLEEVATSFSAAAETKAKFSFFDTPDLVGAGTFLTQVYLNLFNRAPDTEGLAFWTDQLESGDTPVGEIILAIIEGAQDSADGQDRSTMLNKVEVGLDWATDAAAAGIGLSSDPIAEEIDGKVVVNDQAAFDSATGILNGVDGTAASVTTAKATTDTFISGNTNVGSTFTLTNGIDDFTGTANNDTFTAQDVDVSGTQTQTFKALDSIDGAGGTDTFNLFDQTNAISVAGSNVSNVEIVNVKGAAAVTVDSSSWTGVEQLNVQQAGGAVTLTGSSTTDVSASGLGDFKTDINGGKSATVTQTMNVAADDIDIDNVGDVTVTATESDAAASGITIGGTTAVTGAVNVTSTGAATDGAAATLDTIDVTGGTTVNVTQSATSDMTEAEKDTTANSHTLGAVDIDAGDSTTDVTVTQDQEVAAKNFVEEVAGVSEKQSVKFVALDDGESTTIDGLTFTASKDLTAAEVAEAFAGLTKDGDTQDAGGPTANGTYTGSLDGSWVSGAASGDTVVFSQAVAGAGTAFDGNSDTAAGGNITVTKTADAVTAVTGVTGVLGVVNGAVTIDDNATASIKNITVDGYGANATLGGGTSLNALETLTLKNSDTGTATATTTATSLTLNVEDVDATVSLDGGGATVDTLTLNATGEASTFGLTAAAVTDLTVDAAVDLDIATGSTLTAVETVTVSGAGAVDLGDISGTGATSVSATGNTGGVTTTIDGTKAAFTGGSGADDVTVNVADPTKAINLGAGDDTLTLANGSDTSTEVLEGGDGTDTLELTAADAETNSATATFETKINSFERLTIGNASSQEVVNLANLDDIDYVTLGSATGTAQVNTVTVTDDAAVAGVEAGDVFSVTINGTTFSHTATAAQTATSVASDLATLVNADTDLAVTASATTNTFTLTADNAGVPFTVSVANPTDTGGDDTIAVAATTANASGITLNNMASNGTVVLTDAVTTTVGVTDASTGTADSLNIVAKAENGKDFGLVTVDDVETISVSAEDLDTDGNEDGKATLTLDADSAKTVTVSGDADVDLTVSSASSLTTVDASAMTGALTYTADDGTTTVTGGSGADSLTASGSGDKLIGGAGDDTLTGANLTEMTGGAGADTFVFDADINAPTNLNSFSSIMDLSSGDIIDFDSTDTGTVEFSSAAINLADTAVFQDFANAAVNGLGTDDDDAAWFQFDGNTYIVQSGDNTNNNDFQNGTDSIIKIVGTVDLSTASYNQTDGTLEIA
ncbi:DUF4214 domain-containing protein [Roseovarius nitratireducens]|uniref:DUF4214 domain-containing protein n=1 Tax=Roseovarius nitratireducens TaxID=2044597 RepID=UPI000CE1F7E3|nr:DUF4214 domain-containing protein [Roseovarius nitratireducens]